MCKIKLHNIEKMSLGYIKRLELIRNGDIGTSSRVYRLNENECIKLFNRYQDEFEFKRYLQYTEMNFSCAVLPNTLYLINNKFRAFKTDYVDGLMLTEISDDMDYSKYILLGYELIKGVQEISEQGIYVYDSHSENIMYNCIEDKFVLVDQSEWSYNRLLTEEANITNFRIINNTLRSVLFANPFSIGNLKKAIDMDTDFIDFYETERELTEKINGQKIKTIGDFRKLIR